MENLSQPVEKVAIPLAIPAPAYVRDHHVGSLAVLPAVEALQNLARSKPAAWSADPCLQERACFHHLLAIDEETHEIPALHEHLRYADGRCFSRLSTLRSGGNQKVARRMEHLAVWFMPAGGKAAGSGGTPAPGPEGETAEEAAFVVSDNRLYDELVPFGPAYRNVRGGVRLTRAGASATVSGGYFPEAEGPLGSAFPLDAAMHAACAWGQRYRNRVVFPIGFDRREIREPTRTGATYLCRVTPLPDAGHALRFDIGLYGADHRPVEVIRGLTMRDIFGGKWSPPAWVREGV